MRGAKGVLELGGRVEVVKGVDGAVPAPPLLTVAARANQREKEGRVWL